MGKTYEERRAYQREYQREWRKRNVEKARERDRRRYETMSEEERAYRREAQRRRREADPDIGKRINERTKAARAAVVERLLSAQGGRCAICRTNEPGGRHGWHLDHDHSCCDKRLPRDRCGNCERGVLCHGCNMGIGLLAEDVARLRAAADYLEKRRR